MQRFSHHRIQFVSVAGVLVLLLGVFALPTEANAESTNDFEHYVALGDSYTSGPLVPIPLPGPLGCVRSSGNYPAHLAAYFGVKTYTDASCSAARTEHLWETQRAILPDKLPENHNAPQLLALTEETDLVTLGIGGNDFGLFGGLIDNCAKYAEERPEADTPCRDHFTVDGKDTKMRDALAIQDNIELALRAIKAKSPNATVVVINYLRILPEVGVCTDVPFAAGDYIWGNEVHRTLNTSLRNAAELYEAEYIDMYAASEGHDACAGNDAWVNGATLKPLQAANYHPYRSGMKAIADTTYTQLTGKTPPLALPDLTSTVQRLPSLIDVAGLLKYVANGGSVPIDIIADPGAKTPEVPDEPVEPQEPGEPQEPDDGTLIDLDDEPGSIPPSAAPVVDSEKTTPPVPPTSDSLVSGVLPKTGGPALLMVPLGFALLACGGEVLRRRKIRPS